MRFWFNARSIAICLLLVFFSFASSVSAQDGSVPPQDGSVPPSDQPTPPASVSTPEPVPDPVIVTPTPDPVSDTPGSTVTTPRDPAPAPSTGLAPTPAPSTQPSFQPATTSVPSADVPSLAGATPTTTVSALSASTPDTPASPATGVPWGWFVAVVGLILGGFGLYQLRAKQDTKVSEEDEPTPCWDIRKRMEEKLAELTDIRALLTDKTKEKIRDKALDAAARTRAVQLVVRAERMEKEYNRLKGLYEQCLAGVAMRQKYVMRVVRGSITDPVKLDDFRPTLLERFADPAWDSLLEMRLTRGQIKEVQKLMVRNSGSTAPWYMEGQLSNDSNSVLVAFGADDDEEGRMFTFDRKDKKAFEKVVAYAASKGIPREQMNFLEAGNPR